MSRFEMSAYEPEKIQFELKATFTLKEWKEVRDSIERTDWYGPSSQLKEAIDEMVTQVGKDYRAWPKDPEVE